MLRKEEMGTRATIENLEFSRRGKVVGTSDSPLEVISPATIGMPLGVGSPAQGKFMTIHRDKVAFVVVPAPVARMRKVPCREVLGGFVHLTVCQAYS
ncbi:hypothetical protein HAX54_002972 [Datura stramonium]|uniref:Uncharacterized protein n=1 Tax=Datura stramonium TaxID=4076 RepID=A0ABS8T4Q1_DATST|nr:hypothetical protein [Datura stramonium]